MMEKILMIVTSHEDMENTKSKTGLWLGEFTSPYYVFIDKGYEVEIASPMGGEPPIDPLSKLTKNITSSNRRFNSDEKAQHALQNTLRLSEINAEDYIVLFIPGGHGPIWDLATDTKSGQLILDFLQQEKYVASVCHGPAAFLKAEERMALRTRAVPYSLEDRLKKAGADFSTSVIPFTSHTVQDGLFITGQNPAAAGPAAQMLVDALEAV